ncbi:SDR family NAD(P)-dependent oxidoreductase [Albimonas sp. CAU 1670]|uniref:SDR family NAD(P)-dependent oxidoreductase n=1 Tax=Albimonas sp. CAU 1670 TaxID=3032599 RepID=UPI0023DA616A|nr:SDR family NAD(P)-dependent oxidoreductase [Albimonas sp. CAU 1670]MDF2234217.1 SDR family NAD(P)-dependent oxidoreductase [Albimonas sp. CAU 1670]
MTHSTPVAFVTGGGTGVGAAAALMLADRGHAVAVNYSRSAEEAEATAEACRAKGVEAIAIQGNVGADADCRRMAQEVADRWGRLDVLINAAGTTRFISLGDLETVTEDDFDAILDVNLKGAFWMTRAAATMLKASPAGAVVMISSMSAVTGMGSSIPYAASKGAMNTMTLSLARALAPKVRVNAVLPGMIDTRWFRKSLGEKSAVSIRDRSAKGAALGDVCTAEDVAAGAVYLALDARMVTGELMQMDGGALLGPAAFA